ncbi:MAG: hypothetical protein QMD65_01135 [Patescibacteria group bacterium]|nr:hypothetical protein [Patescibacteria group bacterium]
MLSANKKIEFKVKLSPAQVLSRISSSLREKKDIGFSYLTGWHAFPYHWWHLWIISPELKNDSKLPFRWLVGKIDGASFEILKIRVDWVATPVRLVGAVEESDDGAKLTFRVEKNRNIENIIIFLMIVYGIFYFKETIQLLLSFFGFGIGIFGFELTLKREEGELVDFMDNLFSDVKINSEAGNRELKKGVRSNLNYD